MCIRDRLKTDSGILHFFLNYRTALQHVDAFVVALVTARSMTKISCNKIINKKTHLIIFSTSPARGAAVLAFNTAQANSIVRLQFSKLRELFLKYYLILHRLKTVFDSVQIILIIVLYAVTPIIHHSLFAS